MSALWSRIIAKMMKLFSYVLLPNQVSLALYLSIWFFGPKWKTLYLSGWKSGLKQIIPLFPPKAFTILAIICKFVKDFCHSFTFTHKSHILFSNWIFTSAQNMVFICGIQPIMFSSYMQVFIWYYFTVKWLRGTHEQSLHHSHSLPY